MNAQVLTHHGFFILEDLPRFFVICSDLLRENQGVPVGEHYFRQNSIYQYVWYRQKILHFYQWHITPNPTKIF